jgi:Animal haem peroxidase
MSGEQQAKHGSESYFVVGEGLLGESGGGRTATATAGLAAGAPPFRFSRIGPKGTALDVATRKKIANAMTPEGGAVSDIPAGFTYLGQFVDHDLTFDKTQVMLGEDVSPAELIQGRSPSLDLDTLYGAGPQDEKSAKFYTDDRHLKMGKTVAFASDTAHDGFDLPRVGGTGSAAAKRKALIPDFRNDENLAVAQTHLAMIRFHNRVVDHLPASVPAAQRFATARKRVVKHYQWMVRHDFLPRICQASVLDDVFSNGRKIFEFDAIPTDVPTMPIEFSVAAYRLGHSMIRAAYAWNARFPDRQGTLDLLFQFSGTSGNLGGNPRLPSNWIADFRRLYHFNRKDLSVPEAQFNRAMRIDARLVNPLKNLPPGAFGGPPVPVNDPTANLAFRNLTRAKMVKLATGQQMVTLLKARGVPVNALTKSQILNGNNTLQLDNLTTVQRDSLATKTPLWFYILREAELNDGKLKGVGARIVAETFHRAIEGSKFSIVRDTDFHPTLGPDNATFRMVDLLLFAFEGKKKLLAPLG